ncbi:hypothetical protein L0669_15890 [Flavobacterium bizetiae]|uniref:hypothetical protein n=1 Tax=Flavobacterium bizetiae TaxID=2704140 RepID=UPI0021E7BDA0|nr:hypothetical protein [Flavobacterium bizetiae]UTN02807.1 hypothetical protein L0669_15890 [Flavobacterium bizetiae]
MKNIIVLLLIMAFYSCDKVHNDNNITIKNIDLKDKILRFNEDAKHYTVKNTDNTVSVAFWKENHEIRIGLFSSKRLKHQHYIGKTNLDKLTVYFYSNDKSTFEDLIDVRFNAKESENKKDISDSYTCFYTYKNGKLELISAK